MQIPAYHITFPIDLALTGWIWGLVVDITLPKKCKPAEDSSEKNREMYIQSGF